MTKAVKSRTTKAKATKATKSRARKTKKTSFNLDQMLNRLQAEFKALEALVKDTSEGSLKDRIQKKMAEMKQDLDQVIRENFPPKKPLTAAQQKAAQLKKEKHSEIRKKLLKKTMQDTVELMKDTSGLARNEFELHVSPSFKQKMKKMEQKLAAHSKTAEKKIREFINKRVK